MKQENFVFNLFQFGRGEQATKRALDEGIRDRKLIWCREMKEEGELHGKRNI